MKHAGGWPGDIVSYDSEEDIIARCRGVVEVPQNMLGKRLMDMSPEELDAVFDEAILRAGEVE